MKKEQIIEIKPITVNTATVVIEGDSELVLNKMNARNTRSLTGRNNGNNLTREIPNKWEDIITAIHWRDPIDVDAMRNADEEDLMALLKNNAPCISAFGLKKSFCAAVVRNQIDSFSTKFDSGMNIIAKNNMVPITFSDYSIDERLMSPKRGSPVLVYISHFGGWRAEIDIQYTGVVYNLEQIVNIINIAGFGLGIGSGRSSGYGRYHVADVK